MYQYLFCNLTIFVILSGIPSRICFSILSNTYPDILSGKIQAYLLAFLISVWRLRSDGVHSDRTLARSHGHIPISRAHGQAPPGDLARSFIPFFLPVFPQFFCFPFLFYSCAFDLTYTRFVPRLYNKNRLVR